MNNSISSVLKASAIKFGTSGARGLVEQFTDKVYSAFTVASLIVMREQGAVDRLAIGMDRRPSSPGMAATCSTASWAHRAGIKVVSYGILPSPALQADGVPAIMITGIHITFDRNGIKFYRPEGEVTKADEQAIMNVAAELPALGVIERAPESDLANRRYLARYVEWFPGQPLAGKRIGVYQHSVAGRDLNVQVLEALGAEAVVLGRSEPSVPVDTEAVSEGDRALGRAWAAKHQLDALFTTDGDGDRPLMADEHSSWLRGDIVGLLCARKLGIQALAVPVSCNAVIEVCGVFDNVQQTRIGSPYILEEMAQLAEKYECVAGFEANGDFMLGTAVESDGRYLAALPTRDALLPALTLLVAAAEHGIPVSSMVDGLPGRFTASDRLKEIPTEISRARLAKWMSAPAKLQEDLRMPAAIVRLDTTDDLRATLDNGDIVHLRSSGNAPELRCYVESGTAIKADNLLLTCIRALEHL